MTAVSQKSQQLKEAIKTQREAYHRVKADIGSIQVYMDELYGSLNLNRDITFEQLSAVPVNVEYDLGSPGVKGYRLPLGDKNNLLFFVEFVDGIELTMHRHSDSDELVFVHEGKVWETVSKQIIEAKSALNIPANEYHHIVAIQGTKCFVIFSKRW